MNIHSSNIQGQIDGEREDKGFTLIEILIAIVLVGILSAVAVVGISNLVSKGCLGVHRDWRLRQSGISCVLRGQRQLLSDHLHRVDHCRFDRCGAHASERRCDQHRHDRLQPDDRGRWNAVALRHQLVPDDDGRERHSCSDVRLHSLT